MTDQTEYVPDDGGLEEFRELRALSDAQVFVFEFLRLMSNAGFPAFDVKQFSTTGTNRVIVNYQLNNILQALLVALRARNGHSAEVEGGSGKRSSFPRLITHVDRLSLSLGPIPPAEDR